MRFIDWLLEQQGRGDPVGDLASDAKRQPPRHDNPSLKHFYELTSDSAVQETMIAAFREWQGLGHTYRMTTRGQ